MSSERCRTCEGRGFQWKHGKILSRVDGSEIAHTYRQGDACLSCYGTGKRPVITIQLKQALKGAALLIPLVFGGFWVLSHLV
jgi:RecJ-like exonuclease